MFRLICHTCGTSSDPLTEAELPAAQFDHEQQSPLPAGSRHLFLVTSLPADQNNDEPSSA